MQHEKSSKPAKLPPLHDNANLQEEQEDYDAAVKMPTAEFSKRAFVALDAKASKN